MAYIVLHPGSNTNPSDKYRVVDYDGWLDVIMGNATTVEPLSEHDNYKSAETAKDEANTDTVVKMTGPEEGK